MKILSSLIAFFALATPHVNSALITIEPPSGVSLGAALGLDFDGDTIDDAVVRFYDPICISGGSASRCSHGVTITFASNVEILGSISEGLLTPGFLDEGAFLGVSTPAFSWTSTGNLALDLIYRYGDPSYPNDGYLPYAQSRERMYLGFRIVDGLNYRYGYFDVQLIVPSDGLPFFVPKFNGVYVGETSQDSILVSPIPEPSTLFMVIGGALFALSTRHKKPKDAQAGSANSGHVPL